MTLDDLRELDPQQPGEWPFPVKLVTYILLAILMVAGGYWFIVKDQFAALEREEKREPQLRETFEEKQRLAASLPAMKLQMDEIQQKFGGLLAQLPNKNDVDKVLDDISQTRVASGASEKLFKPGSEVTRDFYAELPIDISLVGTYSELGEYVSGVANLSRIVTLHSIDLRPQDRGGSDPKVEMKVIAKTYRYLEDQ